VEVSGKVTESDAVTKQGELAFPVESDLELFANKFSSKLQVPLVIWLEGDLGAGKTTFARALVHSLGYQGRVKSPTYGLLEQYQLASMQVLHMDLYRISDPVELDFLVLEDLRDNQTILLVEWPGNGGEWLPKPDFIFEFVYAGQGRDLHWKACTEQAKTIDPTAFIT
jgi:tRNA threonylcarbamoyladenosine biosynthesis protein TsaE